MWGLHLLVFIWANFGPWNRLADGSNARGLTMTQSEALASFNPTSQQISQDPKRGGFCEQLACFPKRKTGTKFALLNAFESGNRCDPVSISLCLKTALSLTCSLGWGDFEGRRVSSETLIFLRLMSLLLSA